MKIKSFLLATALLAGSLFTYADEGMWLPMLINKNYDDMKKQGFKLTADDLYNINKSSIKDAIVWFNGGCTAEIVSESGLLLTNHHCGYDAIAKHSTTTNNILDNGWYAKTKNEELTNPGMWVMILQKMEDVSSQIIPQLAGLNETERAKKVETLTAEITKKAMEGTNFTCQIKEFYKGNAYYMYTFEKFTDIRLVGTPPQSIGKFGGDTDNWEWPRHTGDFSVFRIYANKDNKPADYSKENIPYKPKHFLPVSTAGIKEGDFSMVYGFPGRTNRYETSMGVKLAIEKVNPTIVKLRDARLGFWKEEMDKSDSVRLLLSSQYASIANYWKYFIGQTEQLKKNKVYDRKIQEEAAFRNFTNGKTQYAGMFDRLNKAYTEYQPIALQRTYLQEGVFASSTAMRAFGFNNLEKTLMNKDAKPEEVTAMTEKIKATLDGSFASYNMPSDEKIMANALNMYYNDIPKDQHPEFITNILKKFKATTTEESFKKFAAACFKTSMFTSKEKLTAFLTKPELKKLQNDLAYSYVTSFYNNYITRFKPQVDNFNNAVNAEGRLYQQGLMEMNGTDKMYPDANSTLRITYGNVQDYSPKDGVQYSFRTTASGILQKENPNNFEFEVPTLEHDLLTKKQYGNYADKDGELPVAFITNNDITGGNSGSPVINGNGELIGLAFDGNWEAMSGDISFDKNFKRTICVDIRYVLWCMDVFGGASNLISEMKLNSGTKTFGAN